MKLTLVARKALHAYLVSSALSIPVATIGVSMRLSGLIQLAQQRLRADALHPEHDPVGAHEVLDRRALPEELGIGGHVEVRVGTRFPHQPPDLAGGPTGTVDFVTSTV